MNLEELKRFLEEMLTRPEVDRKATGSHTQSVVFSIAEGWTAASAKSWCSNHDYYADGMDETSTSYRFRQYDPEASKFRYRAKGIESDGKKITLILGFPKGRIDETEARSMLGDLLKDTEGSLHAEFGEEGELHLHLDNAVKREAIFPMEVDILGRQTDIDAVGDEVELSASSEKPYMRWGTNEILSHEKGDVDISRLREVAGILRNHDPDQIIGVPVKVWLDEKTRKVKVRMKFGSTEAAMNAKREVLVDGSLRGASIGYRVNEFVHLADEDVTYRGRMKGPALVATQWEAIEASLTPIAADPSVGVNRSVSVGQATTQRKETGNMDPKFRAWLLARGTNPETLADSDKETLERQWKEEVRAAEAQAKAAEEQRKADEAKARTEQAKQVETAERERVGAIIKLCETHDIDQKMRDEMITDGSAAEKASERILAHLGERRQAMGGGNMTVTTDGRATFARAMGEGMQIKKGVVRAADAKEGGRDFAGMMLREMARECLKRASITIPSDMNSMVSVALRGVPITQDDLDRFMRGDIISGTTSDFPYILAATANKSMLDGYGAVKTTWPLWCKTGNLSDFKAMNRITLSEVGDLQLIREGGTYPQTSLAEDQNAIQVYTYGLKFNLSRQAIINDDMNAFTTIPARHGRAAKRLPNILAVIELCANRTLNDGTAQFATGHNNLSANANYALDTLAHGFDGISNIAGTLATQRGRLHAKAAAETETLYMGLTLENLLVGTWAQAMIARQVLNSTTNVGQSNANVKNPLEGIATVELEPLLGDSGITGYSTTAYFGFANPADAPVVEVAFLNGVQEPYMEEIEQTDADGRIMKVRLDCGAAPIDYLGAAKETGV